MICMWPGAKLQAAHSLGVYAGFENIFSFSNYDKMERLRTALVGSAFLLVQSHPYCFFSRLCKQVMILSSGCYSGA